MSTVIENAEKYLCQTVKDFGSDPYRLLPHVPEVKKWAKFLLKSYPEADQEVVLLSVWLHDIGHYPLPTDIDHAVRGEQLAKAFLEKEGLDKERILKILHCIRSHRCRDVTPNSTEAKIIACADSASHMTEPMYFEMCRVDKEEGVKFRAYDKIERDYRDISLFPEVQKELKGIYEAWKKLLKAYEKINT